MNQSTQQPPGQHLDVTTPHSGINIVVLCSHCHALCWGSRILCHSQCQGVISRHGLIWGKILSRTQDTIPGGGSLSSSAGLKWQPVQPSVYSEWSVMVPGALYTSPIPCSRPAAPCYCCCLDTIISTLGATPMVSQQ